MRVRGLWSLLAVLGVLAGGLVFVGASALAGTVYPFVGGFGLFSNPQSVAVDQASGDVYVIDVSSGGVDKFTASGAPANFSALGSNVLDGASGADLTPEGGFAFDSNSAAQVAVDNSGGATDGYVYVANSFHEVVDVFSSTGAYVGEITGGAASPQSGGEACGVATDGAGHVYMASFNGHVDKYSPADGNPAHDVFVGQLENLGGVCNVAADMAGNIYVSTWSEGPLTRYPESQLGEPSPTGSVVDARSLAVAVDQASGDVFVNEGNRVAEFDQAGVALGQSGSGTLSGSSYGVAVRGSSGDLYASDAGTGQVDRFGPGVNVETPAVTIAAPTGITTSQSTLHGTVNPQGPEPVNDTTWRFEYSTDGGSNWTSTTGGDAGTGSSPVPVEEQITGLLPAEEVQVRLEASNAGGSVLSSGEVFTTHALAPSVVTEPAQDITPDHAVLEATLNAHNAQTSYFFEYGMTTAYGTSVPTGQDGDGGASPDTIAVVQSLHQLQPATTYHYRVVATNTAGTVHGADQTFTTTSAPLPSVPRTGIPGTGILPDNRGWEQVSPPSKRGADIMVNEARTRAAASETASAPMAATFASLGGFGDVRGIGLAGDYMAIRTGEIGSSGWVSHGITPAQDPMTLLGIFQGFESNWAGELSPDLSRGVYRSQAPLTEAPNVSRVQNLYRRDDLRVAGNGSYQLLTDCPACTSPLPPIFETSRLPHIAGNSADIGHVIFESTDALVPDATAAPDNPNLYEWANGTLRLAGVLPDSACGSPPCVAPTSFAGQGAGGNGVHSLRYTPHTISSDGSRILFTDPSGGGDASQGTGALYMRAGGTSTVQLNASEKTGPDAPQPAAYQDASTDGSRVFFTSSEQLTDTPVNGQTNLYMYDVNAPANHHLTLLSADQEPVDQGSMAGVMGASADGRYVYFVAAGQLVAGQPLLRSGFGIYEWHEGEGVSYVGTLAHEGGDAGSDLLPSITIEARVTPDGRHLLFVSSSGDGLTGYQQAGHSELYLYDATSHELQCASCRPNGAPAEGNASVISSDQGVQGGSVTHVNHPLTDDGSRVFFSTTDALVPQDINGQSDAYEFDATSGTVHLLSGGTDGSPSYFMDASSNGSDAFFMTRQQLVGWDFDSNVDLYDARVGGGLPEPSGVPVCDGEECRGVSSPAPVVLPFGSEALQSSGNIKPGAVSPKARSLRCRLGFVRVRVRGRVRCVKATKRHTKRVKTKAKHTRTRQFAHGQRKAR